jgi:hypothetical protein
MIQIFGFSKIFVVRIQGTKNMPGIQLSAIDYILLVIYFIFVLGIGYALRRSARTSSDFFLSGRSIPAWITGLAFPAGQFAQIKITKTSPLTLFGKIQTPT